MPVYAGMRMVFMSPASFLERPLRWLRAISRYRAETSVGPNFAYELCARRVTHEDCAELDLRCWQLAVVGSDPIRAATLERFAEAFRGCGFRMKAFFPAYGLAEAVVNVTGITFGEGP
jgi:acyl-CoA synthetase (AMP-forming)/AMP-acid ligase II